jgi:hypothetical protein
MDPAFVFEPCHALLTIYVMRRLNGETILKDRGFSILKTKGRDPTITPHLESVR